MPKKQDIYRENKPKGLWTLDEFEHHFTCWANHRNNQSKVKAFEKKYAKRRLKQKQKEELEKELEDLDESI